MFVNRSDLLLANPTQLNYGIAVSDVDHDGAFEWLVAGFGCPNLALKWNGRGFIDIADATLGDAQRRAIGVATADIDGDGREEIYVLNTDTFMGEKQFADRLFAHNGETWVDLFSQPENQAVLNLTAGRSVAAVDRLGRGIYGVFVANYGGPLRLYELDDDGRLRDVAPEAGVALNARGRGLLALPLLSQRMDIFAGNEHGPNFFFRNRGDGTYEEIAARLGLDDPYEHVRGIAAVDSTGEGLFDIAYGNWDGPHRLYVQSSDGTWDDIAPAVMAQPSRVRTVIAADFNNDGYQELFFNNIGQANRLFGRRDGDWVPLPMGDAAEPDGLGTGAAVGDLDGDGRLELLIAHGESGAQPLSLYHTPDNGNAYLRVLPLTTHGAPARGAVVTLLTDTLRRRVIDAGSGYLCQMEPVAHFGLGRDPSLKRLDIRWPDGALLRLDDPSPNQLLRVPHPGLG